MVGLDSPSRQLRFLERAAFSPLESGVSVRLPTGSEVGALAGFIVDDESLHVSYVVVELDEDADDVITTSSQLDERSWIRVIAA